jgi:hypothetical protein
MAVANGRTSIVRTAKGMENGPQTCGSSLKKTSKEVKKPSHINICWFWRTGFYID